MLLRPIIIFLSAFHCCSATFGLNNINFSDSQFLFPGIVINEILNFYTISSKNVSSSCYNQSLSYKNAVLANESWALTMLDASSKLQSGILSLDFYELGSFDQCINAFSENSDIRGKYCLTSISLSKNVVPPEINGINISQPDAAPLNPIGMTPGFRWSICVPDSCTVKDVETHLNNYIKQSKSLQFSVEENQCQIKTKPGFGIGDWVVIIIVLSLVWIMLASTVFDIFIYQSHKEHYNALLISFSWYTNFNRLISVSKNEDQISCLHGFRFLSIMWIISGHQYIFTALNPTVNMNDAVNWMHSWVGMLTVGSTVSVDTFFLLSGCVLMYGFLKNKDKGIDFNVPLLYLHRYLRLTPALAAIIIFNVTLMKYMGSGPLWPYIVEVSEQPCRKWWWTSLLYIQNFVNPTDMCITVSWYLQVDMQLYWISPIILLIVGKWPRFVPHLFGSLITIFVAIPLGLAYYYKFPMAFPLQMLTTSSAFTKYYISTFARAGTWIVGLALGYFLHKTKNQRFHINKYIVSLLWISTSALMLYIVFGIYPSMQQGYNYNRVYSSIFVGFHRVFWCFGLSWIIIACAHGYGGPVNIILSLPVLQILGRFTYSMYLTHFTLLSMRAGAMRTPVHFSNFDVFYTYLGTLIIDLLIAVVWTLTFEAPVAVVDTLLFKKVRHSNQEQLPVVEEKNEE